MLRLSASSTPGGERRGRNEVAYHSTERAFGGRFAFRSVATRRVLLELAEVVDYLPPAEEVSGTGDGEVFDTEVNPENRSVLGGIPFGIILVPAEADLQEELAVSGGERTFRNTPFVRVEILTLVAIVGVGKIKRAPDPSFRCREGYSIVIEHEVCGDLAPPVPTR